MTRRTLIPALLVAGLCAGSLLVAAIGPPRRKAVAGSLTPEIGLSLFFRSGQIAPITLVGGPPRYLQEVDIVFDTPTTPTDQGVAPLTQNSELASLDWRGLRLVEEDWRPEADGTWTLQRFYRGAKWMEQPGHFAATPLDAGGNPVGPPLIAQTGKDGQWQPGDDGFVRRFVVRQTVRGCADLNDVTGANSFAVQGLVQWRDALHAGRRAVVIPPATRSLRLFWSQDPHAQRGVAVSHADPSDFSWGYGFQPTLEVVNLPPAGYYQPGDTVLIRVAFKDGQGNRLHPLGSLPTYGQFLRGEIASGLRYFDGFALAPTTYYALKHRESNLILTLAGPSDRLKTPTQHVQIAQFFGPQVDVASVPTDGYTAAAVTIPPASVIFGGFADPLIWDTPVSDVFTLTLPANAIGGTYVASIKARREWAGEALNRAATLSVPVGPTPTQFVAKTGPCNTCHTGPSAIGNVLHGLADRRGCYGCHAPLATEPDAALDIRVHMVHSRSERFRSAGGNINNCSQCHLSPPPGPPSEPGHRRAVGGWAEVVAGSVGVSPALPATTSAPTWNR